MGKGYIIQIALVVIMNLTEKICGVKMPVFTVTTTTLDQYLYQTDLPEMTEFTICFWFKALDDDTSPNGETLFSLWTPAFSNDVLIERVRADAILVGKSSQFRVITPSDPNILARKNTHCITYKQRYFQACTPFRWYANAAEPKDQFQLIGAVTVNRHYNVEAGGFLVVMQDQDKKGGGFEDHNSAAGSIAWLNMWNFSMTHSELNGLNFTSKGNIVNWDTLLQNGATIEERGIGILEPEILQPFSLANQCSEPPQLDMKKVSGTRLKGYALETRKASTKIRCLHLCAITRWCDSVNYNAKDKMCELNERAESLYPSDYESLLGDELMHFNGLPG